MLENVAGQQNDVGVDRPCGVQYGGQRRIAVAAPGPCGIAVIDVQVGAVDDQDVFVSRCKGHLRAWGSWMKESIVARKAIIFSG